MKHLSGYSISFTFSEYGIFSVCKSQVCKFKKPEDYLVIAWYTKSKNGILCEIGDKKRD